MTDQATTLPLAQLLAKYGIRPTKQFGQHLLVDRRHLVKLVEHNELPGISPVLEIGPGPGNLTELLLDGGHRVFSVEIDERFLRLLNDRFGTREHFSLIPADAVDGGRLSGAVKDVLAGFGGGPWALVANLPYQVGTLILVEVMHVPVRPALVCVMVQKEVGQRLKASPATSAYSALSVLAQSYMAVELVSYVPAGSFWPPPKVDSAIIRMTPRVGNVPSDPELHRAMVNAMFQFRRKTIQGGFVKRLPSEIQSSVAEALAELGIDPTLRAQQLDIKRFICLSDSLKRRGISAAMMQ